MHLRSLWMKTSCFLHNTNRMLHAMVIPTLDKTWKSEPSHGKYWPLDEDTLPRLPRFFFSAVYSFLLHVFVLCYYVLYVFFCIKMFVFIFIYFLFCLFSCPVGQRRLGATQCVDANECLDPTLCKERISSLGRHFTWKFDRIKVSLLCTDRNQL